MAFLILTFSSSFLRVSLVSSMVFLRAFLSRTACSRYALILFSKPTLRFLRYSLSSLLRFLYIACTFYDSSLLGGLCPSEVLRSANLETEFENLSLIACDSVVDISELLILLNNINISLLLLSKGIIAGPKTSILLRMQGFLGLMYLFCDWAEVRIKVWLF